MPQRKQPGRKSTAERDTKIGKSEGTSKRKEKENVAENEAPQTNCERTAKRLKNEDDIYKSPDRQCTQLKAQSTEIINTADAAATSHTEDSKEPSRPANAQESADTSNPCPLPESKFESLYELPDEWELEDVEDREHYRIGGFHPVHLDEFLDEDERFEVINKLGFGFHSTVWACLDRETGRLRAVKVIRADQSSENCPELRIQKLLEHCTEDELSDNHVIAPLEHFWIDGPNGRHLCLVLPLVGTSIDSTVVQHYYLQSPVTLKSISYQVAKGAQFLHQKGICHGDLTPVNVLYQIERDDYLTPEETSQLLEVLEEEVQIYDIVLRSNKPSQHGVPEYLVRSINTRELTQRFGRGKVAIADFGLSYLTTDSPKSQEFPVCHSSPGLMIENITGQAADDVWSLACTIYHIMTGKTLFYVYAADGFKIAILEWLFGPLPEIYRQKAREMFATEEQSDEESKNPKSPVIESVLLSKECMKDYDGFMKTRSRSCRFLKDWPQPLQALLREPVWCDDEPSATIVSARHVEGEKEGETKESKDYPENGPTQPNTDSPLDDKTGKAEVHKDPPLVDASISPPDGSEPQGLENDEEEIDIRQQYDLIDQPPSSDGIKEYSLKREEVLILSNLLLQMFQLDPEKRIGIDEVLKHKWFDEVREDPNEKKDSQA